MKKEFDNLSNIIDGRTDNIVPLENVLQLYNKVDSLLSVSYFFLFLYDTVILTFPSMKSRR